MFLLDPRLEADSRPISEDDDVFIRLIDDARFPWVLIVPKVEGATELFDLEGDAFDKVTRLAQRLGRVMRTAFAADKINTAAIGNIVKQLHIHVVARHTGDDAWPGPVWGHGAMVRLSDAEAKKRIQIIRDGMQRV